MKQEQFSVDSQICRVLRHEPVPWPEIEAVASEEEFGQRCWHHGVSALVYHAMQGRVEWANWPSRLRTKLEQSSKEGVAQELLRSHYLGLLLEEFERLGVRCLLTKGEALAASHYPIPGTRSRCDSDIFISLDDIELACQAVEKAGFEIVSSIYKTHQFTVKRFGDSAGAVQFDIHWRISNHPRFARSISFEQAWESSLAVDSAFGARMLDPVNALMLACMHREGNEIHDKNRLIWIYDIHKIVSEMTEQELLEFARLAVQRNVHTACQSGLACASTHFNSQISDDVWQQLNQPETIMHFDHSNLALLINDWSRLPTTSMKRALLGELFLPSADSLMDKYNKKSRIWLPMLYMRQVFGGLIRRIALD